MIFDFFGIVKIDPGPSVENSRFRLVAGMQATDTDSELYVIECERTSSEQITPRGRS